MDPRECGIAFARTMGANILDVQFAFGIPLFFRRLICFILNRQDMFSLWHLQREFKVFCFRFCIPFANRLIIELGDGETLVVLAVTKTHSNVEIVGSGC